MEHRLVFKYVAGTQPATVSPIAGFLLFIIFQKQRSSVSLRCDQAHHRSWQRTPSCWKKAFCLVQPPQKKRASLEVICPQTCGASVWSGSHRRKLSSPRLPCSCSFWTCPAPTERTRGGACWPCLDTPSWPCDFLPLWLWGMQTEGSRKRTRKRKATCFQIKKTD